jgi:N6-L-threonylcarbamoyladenine synthase
LDRLAGEGDPTKIAFAKPMPQKDSLEFSFSGLKTQVARYVHEHGLPKNDQTLRDLAAAFQRVVVDTLMEKTLLAARNENIATIALAGGVSANSSLRARGAELCRGQGVELVVPHFRACTDNAAMIAYAGSFRAESGGDDRQTLEISPKTILPRLTRKGGGPRH